MNVAELDNQCTCTALEIPLSFFLCCSRLRFLDSLNHNLSYGFIFDCDLIVTFSLLVGVQSTNYKITTQPEYCGTNLAALWTRPYKETINVLVRGDMT